MAHFYGKGWLVDWRFNTSPLSPPPCQLKPEELWGRKGWKLVERNRIPKQEIAMNKFNAFTWICFLAFVSWWFLYFSVLLQSSPIHCEGGCLQVDVSPTEPHFWRQKIQQLSDIDREKWKNGPWLVWIGTPLLDWDHVEVQLSTL